MKGDCAAAAPKPVAWKTQQASWRACRAGAEGMSPIGLDVFVMQIVSSGDPFAGVAHAALVMRP